MSIAFMTGGSLGVSIQDLVIDPASVATITTARQTFTVPGLKTTDFVAVSKPGHTAGLGIAGAVVTAADTLGITFVNPTAGAIDAGSETWRLVIIRTQ